MGGKTKNTPSSSQGSVDGPPATAQDAAENTGLEQLSPPMEIWGAALLRPEMTSLSPVTVQGSQM